MTNENFEATFTLSDKIEIRNWIKSSLEGWILTSDAFSFMPYQALFRSKMEPEEVIFSVYSQLDENSGASASTTIGRRFRTALAELIAEPEIVERKPILFGILLRAGATIGCIEVVDALSVLSRQKKLRKIEVLDTFSESLRSFDLLEMAATAVVEGKFSSLHTSKLSKSLIKAAEPDYEILPELFERMLDIEPDQALHHASELANEIQDYLLSRVEFGEEEFSDAEAQLKAIFLSHVDLESLGQENSAQLQRLARGASAFLVSDLAVQNGDKIESFAYKKQEIIEFDLAAALSVSLQGRTRQMTPEARRSRMRKHQSEARTKNTVASERDDAKDAVFQ